jgi:hypothetical protein
MCLAESDTAEEDVRTLKEAKSLSENECKLTAGKGKPEKEVAKGKKIKIPGKQC